MLTTCKCGNEWRPKAWDIRRNVRCPKCGAWNTAGTVHPLFLGWATGDKDGNPPRQTAGQPGFTHYDLNSTPPYMTEKGKLKILLLKLRGRTL